MGSIPDEDGSFHHPVSVFRRDDAHEDLLFKEPFMRIQIQTFRHLDVKRVLLMSPLLKRRVLNTLCE